MARRFSLFRRSEPAPPDAPEAGDEGGSKGFGFVTLSTEDAPAAGDPDRPVIIGSLPDPPDTPGGTDVAVEELTIAHEGFQPTDNTPEIIELTHEIKSPPDAAAGGETIQIHGQYDMDTTIERDADPFAMDEAATDGPSTTADLFRGEVTSIEPGFQGGGLPEEFAEDFELLD